MITLYYEIQLRQIWTYFHVESQPSQFISQGSFINRLEISMLSTSPVSYLFKDLYK